MARIGRGRGHNDEISVVPSQATLSISLFVAAFASSVDLETPEMDSAIFSSQFSRCVVDRARSSAPVIGRTFLGLSLGCLYLRHVVVWLPGDDACSNVINFNHDSRFGLAT